MPIDDTQDPPQVQDQTPDQTPDVGKLLASLFGQIQGPSAPQVAPAQAPAQGAPNQALTLAHLFQQAQANGAPVQQAPLPQVLGPAGTPSNLPYQSIQPQRPQTLAEFAQRQPQSAHDQMLAGAQKNTSDQIGATDTGVMKEVLSSKNKYKPMVRDGHLVYDSNGTLQYEPMLDENGNKIIDPKTGQPMLEQNPYHVSLAKRLLSDFLIGGLSPATIPAMIMGRDPTRQLQEQEFQTDQQRNLETQHWNQLYDQKVMHENQVNTRAAQRQQLQRDQMSMKDSEFQQTYGLSKAQLQLSQQKRTDYMNLQQKKMQNQQLTREEKLLDQAYPVAHAQAVAQYMATHPGTTPEDVMADPSVLADSAQRFEQMKPQAAFNDALQTANANGELAGVPLDNQAAVYKALQSSKTLTKDQKDAVSAVMLPQMMTQGNALQKIDKTNAGKMTVAQEATNRPPKSMMYVPNDDGTYSSIEVRPGMNNIPGNAVSGSGVTQLNVPTAATRGAGEQGSIIQTAGQHLQSVIDQNRAKLGNMTAFWKSVVNGSPIADPNLSYIQSLITSFVALQPKLHGFRGQQAMQEFDKSIGGVPKNPEALIAAIQGTMETAGAVASVGHPNKPQDTTQTPQGVPSVGSTYNGSKVTSVKRIK